MLHLIQLEVTNSQCLQFDQEHQLIKTDSRDRVCAQHKYLTVALSISDYTHSLYLIDHTKCVLYYNGIKIGIDTRKIFGIFSNFGKLCNIFINKPQVKERILREIRKYVEPNNNENITSKFMGCSESNVQREFYSTEIEKKKDRSNPVIVPPFSFNPHWQSVSSEAQNMEKRVLNAVMPLTMCFKEE